MIREIMERLKDLTTRPVCRLDQIRDRSPAIDLFQKLFNSAEWQKYCTDDGLTCDQFLGGNDLMAFHEAQLERHKALIKKVGAAAITSQ